MKKRKIFTFTALIAVAVILVFSLKYFYNERVIMHPFSSPSGNVSINVLEGESLYGVIDKMQKDNQVNSSLLMKYYIKSQKIKVSIKPGSYVVSSDTNLSELIRYLNNGIYDKDIVKVTIPEGFDIEHIAEILDNEGIIKKEQFIKCCREYALPSYIKTDSKRKYELEGYLFPDTYYLTRNMEGKEIIDIFLNRFKDIINNIEKSNNINITDEKLDDIIIMASIVEKEVQKEDERGKAASVFYNRLNKGMKLESCATVLYALGYHKDKLLNKDLEVESPYNTYLVKAFPEGPICSPGRASIIAAIKPDDTKFLFFVSNNDGTHTFTDDYNEFLRVKRKTQGIN